jgi:hypothetical protein
LDRRQFTAALPGLTWLTGLVGGSTLLAGCGSGRSDYETAAAATWRIGALPPPERAAIATELVRYATLAPSSHNTQCWKFRLEEGAITILPDFTRRCPAVDPDDHHLFVSLGCATENLVEAAAALGLKAEAAFDPLTEGVRIRLEPAPPVSSARFQAIVQRQSTRAEYDGRPLSKEDLAQLERAGTTPQVGLLILPDRARIEQVLDYVVQGNSAQMSDPAFVDELKRWIRFSGQDAVRLGDGLFAASSGNPVVPTWLGERMFSLFFTPKAENDKYMRQLRSSAGVAVFVGQTSDKAHWVEVGRACERFALQATTMGVRCAFVNQPVEVTALRPQFAALLGLGERRPDLVVRFGRGPTLPPSLRRPVQAVIV